MKKSLLSAIIDHIFGIKYYMVVLKRCYWHTENKPSQLCSYIFYTKEDAMSYVHESVYGRASGSYTLVCVRSFRCKERLYSDFVPHRHLDYSKF